MCGITGGVWNRPESAIGEDVLRRMTAAIAHRGPDDEGHFRSEFRLDNSPHPEQPGVALGFRRLAIIDVAGSRQPMPNEDGSIQCVFNGEIYNFRDLHHRLEGAGHSFRTDGDTETIVHLYEDEGEGFLEHLNGMFAIALWDANRRRLILARDRLGQKPLLYFQDSQRLLFASELKCLLQVPDVPRNVSPGAIDQYLAYQYVPHPDTIFAGIRKLPPGHYAVYEEGRLRVEPYWQPDFNTEVPLPPGEYVSQLRELLTDSVRLRLQSEVPLGVFLSGGIDSSAIAAVAQELCSQPVKTFSIGFAEQEFDESAYAVRVARHLGTDHHSMRVEPDSLEILDKLVWYYDEPFGDSSAIPTYYLSKMTRAHVTVALSGDGGDELYAGYRRYRGMRLAATLDRLPGLVRRFLAAPFWQRLPSSTRQQSYVRLWKRFSAALGLTPQQRYGELVCIFNSLRRAEMYTGAFIERLPDHDPFEFLAAAYARSGSRDIVTATAATDVLSYLPCDICHKVDIASMANSLECRQPLLDYRLVEQALRMPLAEKIRGGQAKRVLVEAVRGRLPEEVFRRRKQGFGVPLDHWFRHELKELTCDTLLSERALGRGYFQAATIRRLIAEHLDKTFNHAHRLWMLLVLELWHRRWVDREG